jgi:hypothetical protein
MKYATDRPYSDPEKAARRLLEHAQAFEPVQDGRIYIEKINGPALRRNTAPAWSSLSRGAGMIRDLRKIHGWRRPVRPENGRPVPAKSPPQSPLGTNPRPTA